MKETTIAEMKGSSTLNSLPPTSLIICSRNRPKLLADLVTSILEGNEVPTELIIIDDSDSPHKTLGSLTTSRLCEVRYVWTQLVGLSRANNDGIAAARYDLLVFTQDDVLVTSTWFGTIVRALLEAGPRSVVTGQVRAGEAETLGGFAPSTIANERSEVYQGRIGKDVLYVQNMAMYRSIIDEIGGFDQELGPGTLFPAAEDNDFGFRLLEAGYRILYEPRAVTYHRAWRSADGHLALHWNYGRGQGAYYAKHLSLRDQYMLRRVWSDMIHYTLMCCRRLRRQRQRAYCDVIFMLGIFSGAAQWLLTQRRQPL